MARINFAGAAIISNEKSAAAYQYQAASVWRNVARRQASGNGGIINQYGMASEEEA